jgi:hypothetical protein
VGAEVAGEVGVVTTYRVMGRTNPPRLCARIVGRIRSPRSKVSTMRSDLPVDDDGKSIFNEEGHDDSLAEFVVRPSEMETAQDEPAADEEIPG